MLTGWKKYLTIALSGVLALFILISEIIGLVNALHKHSFELAMEYEASCLSQGAKIYVCDCGQTKFKSVKAKGHSLISYEAQDPTCDKVGWEAYTACRNCEYTTYVERAKIEHQWETQTTVDGEKIICEECGVDSEFAYQEHSHVCVEAKILQQPTCTESGEGMYVCECGERVTFSIAPFGHVGVGATCSVAAVCEVCYESYFDFSEHRFVEGRCVDCYIEDENYIPSDSPVEDDSSSALEDEEPPKIEIGEESEEMPTPALQYELVTGGYACTGFASGEDKRGMVVIADTYNGKKVVQVAKNAFANETGIFAVEIGANVTKIQDGAFYNCGNIREVYNRSGLKVANGDYGNGYVGYYASAVYATREESRLKNVNGYVVYETNRDVTLVGYVGNEVDLILPEGITKIGAGAFNTCKNIKSVTLCDSLDTLGRYAFKDLPTLEKVTLGESLKKIEAFAFFGVTALQEVVFANVDGWRAGESKLKYQDLSNAERAATFLKDADAYNGVEWTRTAE